MPLPPAVFRPDWADSSNLLLLTLVAIAVLAGLLYQAGVVGVVIQFVSLVLGKVVAKGFGVWKRLLAWAPWPVFTALVAGLIALGLRYGEGVPAVAILCGLALLFLGVTACLAYVAIDLERYDVSRGYKAIHNPLKGQELAANLARYGHRVGVPLLIAATAGLIAGFALLNQGLYETVGRDWFDLRAGREPSRGVAEEGKVPPVYADFLVYTLLHLFRIVDLLNIADTYNIHISYVHQVAWPAGTLLVLFKSFFTLVLLQQIIASVQQVRLLGQAIQDFWSPHLPIHEQARAALPQHGARAVAPLLASLRSVEFLTAEQRALVPTVVADIGSTTIPVLARHLRDPNDNVRAVAVAALGRLDALAALPRLVQLANDPNEWVRQALAEALGELGCEANQLLRKKTKRGRGTMSGRRWLGWLRRRRGRGPVELAVETLRAALGDTSPAVRSQAVTSLGRIGPAAAPAAPDLIRLLRDGDEAICCRAAESLGRLGAAGTDTVTSLSELLQDASAAVQQAAARALGALKAKATPAVPSLIPLLQDASPQVRQTAAEAISRIGTVPEEAAPELLEGLSHEDNVVRARTVEALGTIGTPAADTVLALVQALEDPNDLVRAKTAEALGKIGPAAAEAVPSLVRALEDADNLVRARAAVALGEMGAAAGPAVPALTAALGHSNPLVRGQAAHALGRIGTAARSALAALEQTAHDDSGEVRSQVVFAVGEIGGPAEVTGRVLFPALEDADPQVRAAAAQALGKRDELAEAGVRALLKAMGDVNDDVKVEAARALPRLADGAPEVVAGLCGLLVDDSLPVQVEAALALSKLGAAATSAGAPLLRALQTGPVSVRQEAIRAIVMIQPPEAGQAIVAGLKDDDGEIRKLASAGLLKAAAIPAEVVPGLVEALRDPEIQVRSNAAAVLARLEPVPAEAVPLLVEATAAPDDGLRMNAVVALKAAAPETVGGVAARLIEDPNLSIRLVAASFVLSADPADPRAGTVLVEALAEPTAKHRKTAVEVVDALGPRGGLFLEAVKQRIDVEEDAEVRALLTQVLERLRPRNEPAPVEVTA
jgi:HEAT repeat protein